jgi:FtsZ-interacting cell division protein ZipA
MRRPRMRKLLLVLIAAALGVSSAFLVACGDRNDLIPQPDASAIKSDLDRAAADHAAQECRLAQADVRRAQDTAERMPKEVDTDLRRTLADNLQVVLQDIQASCGKTQSTQSTQTTATTPTTPTETTQTETTTTETQPTTTETQPTTTEAPPTTTDSGGTPPGGGSGGSGGESP